MGECKFRNRLIKQIEYKYNVPFPSEGLVKQLRIASKQANQEVREFFLNESMGILIAESDNDKRNSFVNFKRKQLIERLEDFPKIININWVYNFSREFRELKAWKGVNLTSEEMRNSEKLVDEIKEVIKDDVMEFTAVPVHIANLREELLEMLKEYATKHNI